MLRHMVKTALATALESSLTTTETGYKAIDTLARNSKPFDTLIENKESADAKPVRDTIVSLNAQAAAIQVVATDLGLGDVVDDDASACDTTDPTAECPIIFSLWIRKRTGLLPGFFMPIEKVMREDKNSFHNPF